MTVGVDGHHNNPKADRELVHVVQTADGKQELRTPDEFAKKYQWKYDPAKAVLRGGGTMSCERLCQQLGCDGWHTRFSSTSWQALKSRRRNDEARILDAIEEHLTHQPAVPTRRRKCLVGLTPKFEHVQPVWELRVGQFRVFYDVDEAAERVHVRAVRRKTPDQRTEDIT